MRERAWQAVVRELSRLDHLSTLQLTSRRYGTFVVPTAFLQNFAALAQSIYGFLLCRLRWNIFKTT